MRQYEDYGPDFDVVRTWVLSDDGRLLTLRDVHPTVSRQEAYSLWNFLCEQLTTAASIAYGVHTQSDSNPRLGCWGPRPDLLAAGIDDDSATALMIGVAVEKTEAPRTPRPDLLVLAVRCAVVASLKSWVTAAEAHRSRPSITDGHGGRQN